MSSRLERMRRETIASRSTLRHHSMNQEKNNWSYQGEIRQYRVPRKIERALKRRNKDVVRAFEEVDIFSLTRFKEGVAALRLGLGSQADSAYVTRHLPTYEKTHGENPTEATLHQDFTQIFPQVEEAIPSL